MRIPRHVWFGWLLVAIWMGLIFCLSTDGFSSTHTSRFIEPFLRWITGGRISEAALQDVHFLIRKFCHVTEYAILGVLLWNAIQGTVSAKGASVRFDQWRVSGLALAAATVYAASDEFHQSFVPSRGASVHDVLIDATGATVGLLLLQGFRRFRQRTAVSPLRPDRF